MTITETCSCGATIVIANDYAPYVREDIKVWRDCHRHSEPVTAELDSTEGPDLGDVIHTLREIGERVSLIGRIVANKP